MRSCLVRRYHPPRASWIPPSGCLVFVNLLQPPPQEWMGEMLKEAGSWGVEAWVKHKDGQKGNESELRGKSEFINTSKCVDGRAGVVNTNSCSGTCHRPISIHEPPGRPSQVRYRQGWRDLHHITPRVPAPRHYIVGRGHPRRSCSTGGRVLVSGSTMCREARCVGEHDVSRTLDGDRDGAPGGSGRDGTSLFGFQCFRPPSHFFFVQTSSTARCFRPSFTLSFVQASLTPSAPFRPGIRSCTDLSPSYLDSSLQPPPLHPVHVPRGSRPHDVPHPP